MPGILVTSGGPLSVLHLMTNLKESELVEQGLLMCIKYSEYINDAVFCFI